MSQIIIHENKSEYTAAEIAALTQANKDLDIKAQGGELTIDETRIRVAYIRLQREGNFKIVVESGRTAKAPKEPKIPKSPKEKISKSPRKSEVSDDMTKAQSLWVKRNLGGVLSEEETALVDKMLPITSALDL